ncbi:MAG: class I SAM-dependent rRNA methyltransferase [Clostridiales bacterium]|nr:class I SAM-dependent rRNA methyltransferase [Clostridiales bacterium]
MPYTVYLKKGEERRILQGHSWVYANEVARIEGKDKNGSLAEVRTFDGKFIGKGYINHLSKILVRIFVRDEKLDCTDEESLYLKRISKANDLRRALGYDNCYRVVFAEADDLPALIVDKYDDILVAQFLSLGIDLKKQTIVDCLKKLFNPRGIYERSDAAVRTKEGLPLTSGVLYGEVPDKVVINENGIKLAVDVKHGQKTGYFLDQKENRLASRRYAKGEVLDCFSNSGGFSLNAALSAESVTAVDISESALSSVNENAALNGFKNINTLQGDVFEILRRFKSENRRFDTVILDPPAFCKSAAEVKDAYRGYKDVNILGMKLVKSGGFLISSSCSHYMTRTLFEKMLAEAAKESGRIVRTLEIKCQAPDHPSLLCADETDYLKFFVMQVI